MSQVSISNMPGTFVASRAQLIYALCLPLAVLMGYFLASPTDLSSIALVVALVSLLSVPLLMRHYHLFLVAAWNAAITPFFLPGAPHLWIVLAFIGFGFAVINRLTNRDAKLVDVPAINRSVLTIIGVLCLTAFIRGGVGARTFGSSNFGGKNYIFVLAACFGYFALISQRIPLHRANLYVGLFFLSAMTALVPNLALLGGSGLYFLYYLFPAFLAQEQASVMFGNSDFGRLTGLSFASMGFYCWILSKYGLRGLFDINRLWRVLLFLGAMAGCLFTGFRSFLLLFGITVTVQFFLEGLHKTRVVPILVGIMLIAAAVVLPNAERLPPVVQRSLSFLPIEINPVVRESSANSSDWRLRMWQDVLQDLPKYLLVGKGYAINPDELEFAQVNMRRGFSPDYSGALVAGDYHSGPLTVVVPLGVWGLLALGALFVTGLKYLVYQHRHGISELKTINRFLLVFFIARMVQFFLVFGAFSWDLFMFTGILGLSVSLNGPLETAKAGAWADEEEKDDESLGGRLKKYMDLSNPRRAE